MKRFLNELPGARLLPRIFLCATAFCALTFGQAISTSQITGTVADSSGAVIPGARVRVTQTDIGFGREVESAADGGYLFTNLPIGPYQLQVTREGFQTYVQNGILLQVGSNPVLNAVLTVGAVSEQVEVVAGANMVETQSSGVGQVVDHQRIAELPLNGRQVTSLIYLAGAAAPAAPGDLNTNKNYPTATISVSGGLLNGITYILDGGTHNDPFNSLSMPLPFPDALQEFKVETNALPAQYGQHASAAVNVITKSGTNTLHGDAFEYVRNYKTNARDFLSPSRDSLKRNQFGGVIGGPITKNKLFYFAGYQGTIDRSSPPSATNFVPTQQMLQGDFTVFASAQCQGSGAKTLGAPFVGNRISASLINPVALTILKSVPVSPDPCGKIFTALPNNDREHQILGRIDYVINAKQSFFGRYFIGNYNSPTAPSALENLLLSTKAGQANQDQTITLGHTYLLSPRVVNLVHATVIRTRGYRTVAPFFAPQDIGIPIIGLSPKYMTITVTGGFNAAGTGVNPGYFNTTDEQLTDDLSVVRGSHQMSFGVDWIHTNMNSISGGASGSFTFSGQVLGLGLADFVAGKPSAFSQGNPSIDDYRQNYLGVYAQDSWKIMRRLTLNYGVRWEPYFPSYEPNLRAEHFDLARFSANQHSTVYPNAPAGLTFPGDSGFPGRANNGGKAMLFAPRIGAIWSPTKDDRMIVRASYGIFYDEPQLFFDIRFGSNPPFGNSAPINVPAGGLSDPWAGVPGGNPFPGKFPTFPVGGVYVNIPTHFTPTYLQTWNLSVQRQFGNNVLLTASYLGSETVHLQSATETNPGIVGPGATLGNINSRRRLNTINPTQAQYFATIGELDPGGTASYEGMLLSGQRRLANGVSALANFTWSHCISDPPTTELTGPTYINPLNRSADRSNCASDRRRIVNISVVANSKLANKKLDRIFGGWQLSPIARWQTGGYSTISTGVDNNLTGVGTQRPFQLLADVYSPNRTYSNYLNPKAFGIPGPGQISTMRPLSVLNPGTVSIDFSLARWLAITERQRVQVRADVFNAPNIANAPPPVTSLNATNFGQMAPSSVGGNTAPGLSTTGNRVMQFSMKYVF